MEFVNFICRRSFQLFCVPPCHYSPTSVQRDSTAISFGEVTDENFVVWNVGNS